MAWPQQFGGLGLSPLQQLVWIEECVRAQAPGMGCFTIALGHAGPTIIECGTPEQQERYLSPILAGNEPWCQGFSEPESGSDLASLRTSAVIDGDDLVISGQKVWTSFAEVADFQELLVRTDPEAPRHQGISWLILDMHAPGVDVRPIRAIDGRAEFAEVLYDQVRVPLSNVVGGLNNGWAVAMTTLGFERGTGYLPNRLRLLNEVDDLIEEARQRGCLNDDRLSAELATLRAEAAAVRSLGYEGMTAGLDPDLVATVNQVFYAEVAKRAYRTALDVLGADAIGNRVGRGLPRVTGGDDLGWDQGHPEEHPGGARAGVASMIDLSLDDAQRDLVAVTRRRLARAAPDWLAAADHGWICEAEAMPLIDQLLIFIELGRALMPGPVIGTAVAARALSSISAEELAAQASRGGLEIGLITGGIGSHVGSGGLAIRVSPGASRLVRVTDAQEVPAIDGSVPLVRVHGEEDVADLAGTSAIELLEVLLGAYLVGVAEATAQMSVEYAARRHQFGRPIGSFQAVKHRCAEMTIRAHVARAQLQVAALMVDDGDGAFEAAAGHVLAVDAARRNAEDNVQNHGGIGFTDHHPAGQYLKRAELFSRTGPSLEQRTGVLLG